MELFFNSCWLLLFVPGVYLWNRSRRRVGSWQSLFCLGCLIALLFPVISASDDLHALRQEIEEPGISKRLLQRSAVQQSSAHHSTGPAPLPTANFSTYFSRDISAVISNANTHFVSVTERDAYSGLSPPSAFIA